MERNPDSNIHLPPGFRFHPTDEELIVHYLRNKAASSPVPASIVTEVDLYKYNPWELPKKALYGEEEWYFFTPRDRKYPNGVRPNRAAASGYWKATGIDRPIFTSCGSKRIGVKKGLVFYKGRPPNGVKTDWIMHEYRLLDTFTWPSKRKGSMRLDDWVLCRVRLKSNNRTNVWEDRNCPSYEPSGCFPKVDDSRSTNADLNVEMIRNYLHKKCPLLPYMFASQDLSCVQEESSISCQGNNINGKTLALGNYSDKSDMQFSVSSFDSLFNPQKREPREENQYESFLPPSKKLNCNIVNEKEEDTLFIINHGTKKSFCGTDQSEGESFLDDQWNSITQYEELNHLAFIERN